MTGAETKSTKATQQEVCIDLPGETVQCWRSSDDIKVVLKKHRDVIFDLNLGRGRTYRVHATESNFYNARDKKLVHVDQREVVEFRDGERTHLWVPRNFKGSLVLKCDGETLMKLTQMRSISINMTMRRGPSPRRLSLRSETVRDRFLHSGRRSCMAQCPTLVARRHPLRKPTKFARSSALWKGCSKACRLLWQSSSKREVEISSC